MKCKLSTVIIRIEKLPQEPQSIRQVLQDSPILLLHNESPQLPIIGY